LKIATEYDLQFFTSSHYYYQTNNVWKFESALAVDLFFNIAGARNEKRSLNNVEDYYFDLGHFALRDECDAIAEKIIQFYVSKVEVQSSKLNNKQAKKNLLERSI